MSLFAPKCDRCGKKTRNEEEGKPVCDACVNEMALILDATEENARHCPVDDSVMQKESCAYGADRSLSELPWRMA